MILFGFRRRVFLLCCPDTRPTKQTDHLPVPVLKGIGIGIKDENKVKTGFYTMLMISDDLADPTAYPVSFDCSPIVPGR